MIFKNKLAYIVKNNSRNRTNTKDYSLLNENFVFEATFSFNAKNGEKDYEGCVLGRTGYNMGLYVIESENLRQGEKVFSKMSHTIKWVWFRENDGDILYENIIFALKNTPEEKEAHGNWWKEYIKKNAPTKPNPKTLEGLTNRWAYFDSSFLLGKIKDKELKKWAMDLEKNKNTSGSFITDKVKVSVVREKNLFKMFIDDIFYQQKEVGRLYDYSDQTICIGVGNPYTTEWDPYYFDGSIFEVKIWNDSEKKEDKLYTWFDFENKTQFKLFDKSLNGNHAELFEQDEIKIKKNEEFNQYARPAKII